MSPAQTGADAGVQVQLRELEGGVRAQVRHKKTDALFAADSNDESVCRSSEKKRLFLPVSCSLRGCVTYDTLPIVPEALLNGQCVSGEQKTDDSSVGQMSGECLREAVTQREFCVYVEKS